MCRRGYVYVTSNMWWIIIWICTGNFLEFVQLLRFYYLSLSKCYHCRMELYLQNVISMQSSIVNEYSRLVASRLPTYREPASLYLYICYYVTSLGNTRIIWISTPQLEHLVSTKLNYKEKTVSVLYVKYSFSFARAPARPHDVYITWRVQPRQTRRTPKLTTLFCFVRWFFI